MQFLFLAWICIAAVCDARYRKSFNWIALSGLLVAIGSLALSPDTLPVKIDFWDALIGALGAFFIFIVFYQLKMMGAGDVKFATALGAWVGWEFFLLIWALSCGFALLHGLVVRSDLKYFFSPAMKWQDGTEKNTKRFIPYVTYLSAATVIVLMLNK